MDDRFIVAVSDKIYVRDLPACEDCSGCAGACAVSCDIDVNDLDCVDCPRTSPAAMLSKQLCTGNCSVLNGHGFAWRSIAGVLA